MHEATRNTQTVPDIRWAEELPDLAFDPRVTRVCDLGYYTPGPCSECPELDGEQPGQWHITCRQRGVVNHMDVCGSWCTQDALTHLLSDLTFPATDIRLHLPNSWAVREDARLAAGCDAYGKDWAVERATNLLTGAVEIHLTVNGRTVASFKPDDHDGQSAMTAISAALTGEAEAVR